MGNVSEPCDVYGPPSNTQNGAISCGANHKKYHPDHSNPIKLNVEPIYSQRFDDLFQKVQASGFVPKGITVDAFKIDVESFEPFVIDGALEVFNQRRVLKMQAECRRTSYEYWMNFHRKYNYFKINRSQLVACSKLTRKSVDLFFYSGKIW